GSRSSVRRGAVWAPKRLGPGSSPPRARRGNRGRSRSVRVLIWNEPIFEAENPSPSSSPFGKGRGKSIQRRTLGTSAPASGATLLFHKIARQLLLVVGY